jgi:Scramblase
MAQPGFYAYNSGQQDPYGQPGMAQPMMQPGFGQPMMQPGYGQPMMQPGMQPMMQPGMQPMMQPMMQPGMQPMMQPGMMMPNNPMFNPNHPNAGGMTGLDPGMMTVPMIFSTINTGIYIKQKFDLLEAMTGCDTPNRYYVYELNKAGEAKKKKIFKCIEKSGWCARNCMSSDSKPFEMFVYKQFKDEDYDTGEPVLKMVRECQCTCFCCNRPEMKVYYIENGQNEYLGKVVDTWDCVNYSFAIYAPDDKMKFFIKASCCQCGFHCNCPCEPCEKIEFDLWSGDKEKEEPKILKTGKKNCVKNLLGDADNFQTQFPMQATWQDKALLMSSMLMIDFMMFEEKSGGDGKNNGMMLAASD